MHPVNRTLVLLLLGVLVTTSLAPVAVAPGGRPLAATLSGDAEVPGPGDPDGSGAALVRVNPGQGTVCWEITVSDIAPATASHIHEAPPGVAGPVVVPLSPPTDGSSSGCADVDRELALAILKDPGAFYVNVHNADFPAGAVRGQLEAVEDDA